MIQNYSIKYNKKIQKFCAPLKEHFGVNYFWYYKITSKGRYHCFGSHIEWMEHYYEERLHKANPFLRHPSNYCSGVSLIRKVDNSPFQESLNRGFKLFNVNLSLVLLERHPDFVEGYGFGTSLDSQTAEEMYLAELPLLNLFSKQFRKEFESLIDLDEEAYVDLTSEPDFHKTPPLPKPNKVEDFLRKIGYFDLSGREREILFLISKGYSARQAADHLMLSSRTVEHYIENIKNKLNCFSKRELVQAAQEISSLGFRDV